MPNAFIQPIPIGAALVGTGGITTPIWLNWFNSVFSQLNITPITSNGILPPTSTPRKVGDFFVDTNAKKLYVAVGTTSSSDWQIVN